MVQTIGSAGESLAAGAIFTMPVLFFRGKSLIVKEHGILPYPEGTACAEVLLAGEKGGEGARNVFWGMGIGAGMVGSRRNHKPHQIAASYLHHFY